MNDDLQDLMERFLKGFPDARVGRGPKHPTEPRRELGPKINGFLRKYKFLQQDIGYVVFLKTYAGAFVSEPYIDIAGFTTGLSLHLTDDEGDVIENGQMIFAEINVHVLGGPTTNERYENMTFGFEATGTHPPGIYITRYLAADKRWSNAVEIDWQWFCKDFLTWLRLLIETRGHLYLALPNTKSLEDFT